MTDKQIIDGVDVSGCIKFRPDVETTQVNYTNACSIGIWQRRYSNLEPSCIMSCSCKDNPNCYYKQLKRKEQECERLKKQNEIMLKSLKKLQNKLCSSTSQCKYFLIDVLKEVENDR